MGNCCQPTTNVRHQRPKKSTLGMKTEDPEVMMTCAAQRKCAINSREHLMKRYEMTGKVLGSGSFGKVYLAANTADKTHKVAIKVIPKKDLNSSYELDTIREEFRVLKALDHPNIVKYHDTYESKKFMYVVTEYCSGGEIFQRLSSKTNIFRETEAMSIMKKLFQAVKHCHVNNIAHRDIKPENIMYSSNAGDAEVKLIDFGLAKRTASESEKLKTMVGTPYYVAPEVLNGNYGFTCDVWSLGVVLYIMLSGYMPFSGDSTSRVFAKIKEGKLSFKQKEWNKVSVAAKDLIKKLLCVDIKKRLTITQALEHEWFTSGKEDNNEEDNKLDPAVVESLRQYRGFSRLRKEAMNLLVKMLDEKELEHLREQFRKMDTDNSGMIEANELESAIRALGHEMPANEIRKIIERIDITGSPTKINYTEFLAATISSKQCLTDERVWALFKHFDVDDANSITGKNIKEVFEHAGVKISDDEVEDIIVKHDSSKNGRISFNEFKSMMLGKCFSPKAKKIRRATLRF